MADTESFENTMRGMSEKLERLRRKNELVRLTTEITLLERQINDLETPNSGANMSQTETPRSASEKHKPRRLLPDVPPRQQIVSGHITPPVLTPNVTEIVQSGQPVRTNSNSQPLTSTPKQGTEAPAALQITMKGSSGAKIKPATYDGTGQIIKHISTHALKLINAQTKRRDSIWPCH